MFNRTANDWDSGCYLINDFEGGLHENFFELRKVIKSDHMFFLEIQIFIPALVQEQTLQIHFQFVTPRLRPFGERMIARLHIVHNALSNADYVESQTSESVVEGMSDDVVYTFASQLSDQGYGSFEQCLAVLTACQGDVPSAKAALSKVIFKQKKYLGK